MRGANRKIRALSKLGQDEWRKRIESIRDILVRTKVARIVWWDWYSLKTKSDRWFSLDEYLRQDIEGIKPPQNEVEDALVHIGYTRAAAKKRIAASYRSKYHKEAA